ncbi:MAG: hypothetical protein M3290_07960 [Actinomycetota bacterium]|nr:hypothetical protein [Actinomycetota bacterium]
MTVVRGALVPHAPILLPELESPEIAVAARNVRQQIASIDLADVDLMLVASPHGARTAVYGKAAGSLQDFGVPGDERWWFGPPDLVSEVSRGWGRPTMDGSIDHGALVPLALLGDFRGSVVVAAFAEDGAASADVMDLVEALDALDARVLVVASAHLSASLTSRAPLTYRSESEEIDNRVVESLSGDPAQVIELAPELATRGGSCSASTLHLYGRLFAGGRSRLLAYEKPVGVGYPVAVAGTP